MTGGEEVKESDRARERIQCIARMALESVYSWDSEWGRNTEIVDDGKNVE